MPYFLSAVSTPRAAIFTEIYRRNAWNGRGGTRAGPGSSLEATARLREALPKLVAELGVSSVLDAGAGDSLWMPDLPGYIGVDIVRNALIVARKRHPNRRYVIADICTDELPRCELVICRDALQHLSLSDGTQALANFRASGATWLLASTHDGATNIGVPSGSYYQINMLAPPFSFPEPSWAIPDGVWASGVQYPHKRIGLWRL